jgi:hypothetical protein
VTQPHPESTAATSLRVFTFAFLALLALHFPLLRLPYFWDEAGYYVPAARDLLLTGSFIPYTTPSNAHPPLVMAWLALWWKIFGYAPVVTRTAMLGISAFALTGLFRLARRIANIHVAIASVICTALYPVFFAQSSMAHVDMAAAAFTFWALDSYFAERLVATAIWFSLAVLSKETAILAPAALFVWELVRPFIPAPYGAVPSAKTLVIPSEAIPSEAIPAAHQHIVIPSEAGLPARGQNRAVEEPAFSYTRSLALLAPALPLALWYVYHYAHTGFIFGNPEFFRYNVAATTNPLRIFLALLMRLYQTLGYMNLFILTLLTAYAMRLPALKDGDNTRPRIAIPRQLALLALIAAYVLALSVIGGAVLARYMLPVVPLVIIICVSTLRRRLSWWRTATAVVAFAFIAGWFINPPHGFSPEDNLAYSDFVRLHQHAAEYLEAHYPRARILTAWPANDELTQPFLGYVSQPMTVLRIEDFTAEELLAARAQASQGQAQQDQTKLFDVAFVFSTKYDPPHSWFERWVTWQRWKMRFFGYHRDVPPEAAAQILGGRLVYVERQPGEWAGVIEIEQPDSIQEAKR